MRRPVSPDWLRNDGPLAVGSLVVVDVIAITAVLAIIIGSLP